MKKVYVATVQIAVEVDEFEQAVDWIHGLMDQAKGPEPFDWAYVKLGSQYLYPTEHSAGDEWSLEGDL